MIGDMTPLPIGVHVCVPSLDVDQTLHFYSTMFSLTVLARTSDLIHLDIAGAKVSLRQVAPGSTSLQSDGLLRIRARHFGFRLETPEAVDGCERALPDAGGQLVMGAQWTSDEGGGSTYCMFCCDPSGNQVEIYCTPPE